MTKKIIRKQTQFRLKPPCAALLLAFAVQTAQANPIGAAVVNGQAGFATSGNTLTVTNTPGAIINWQGFSIGANEITRFAQQSASSSVLNRVISNNPSSILGSLQSNGRVFLVNPNGIVFGQGATINVAGMVASTLNLSNADFLAGRYNFTDAPGAQNISNAGSISAQNGGQIYLIAPNVENSGIINAPNGEVILAAGQKVELIDTGTPGVKVEVTGATGNVTNLGSIASEAGRIGIVGALVKNSGTLNANSAFNEGGRIFLKASQDAYVEKDGKIVATGSKGGSIEVLGNRVAVMDNAQLDASGQNGGGSVLVGGDYQGKNPAIQNSQITYFGPQASIKADAAASGDGGKVIVWADDTTRAFGSISARGGNNGGNGGFVETSGHNYLDFQGRVDTRAPQGSDGALLLDPADVTIDSAGPYTPNGGGFSAANNGIFSGATGPAIITWATINAQTGSLDIQTSGAGDFININASGAVTGPTTLTLLARDNLTFANGVSVSGGSCNFNLVSGWNGGGLATTSGTGTITFGAGSSLSTTGYLLLSVGNAVNQDPSAAITANTLGIIGSQGGIRLPGGASLPGTNMVDTLAVDIADGGAFDFSNGKALTIGAASGFNGISASGNPNAIKVTTTVGNLTVAQPIVSDVLGGSPITLTAANTLTVNAAVTSTNNGLGAGPVVLEAGAGGVTSNASGVIWAGGLKVASGGSVSLNAANKIEFLAGSSAGSFQFADTDGFTVNTVGAVAPLIGLTASTGDIMLKVGTANSLLNINQPVTATNGSVSYISEHMALAAMTTATAAGKYVEVKPLTGGTNIDLGGADANGILGLTAAELGQITTNVLRVGDLVNTGNINVSAVISPANVTTLSLLAGGGITQAAAITIGATNLAIQANGNVVLDTVANPVTNLAATVSCVTCNFSFKSSGNLNIASGLDGVSGISMPGFTTGGVIALESPAGAITQSPGANLGGSAVYATGNSVMLANANPTGVISGSTNTGNFEYHSANQVNVTTVYGVNGILVPGAADAKLKADSGGIVLNQSIVAYNAGGGTFALDAGSGGFDNNVGAGGLSLNGGRWLVYTSSTVPTANKNGLSATLYQYNTAVGGTVAPAGSGFIYASPLYVDANFSGTMSSTYGTNPTATPGYALRGLDVDDTITTIVGSASYSNWPITSLTAAGSYPLQYVSGLSASAFYTLTPGTSQAYTVDPAPITIITVSASLTGTANKAYDGTTNATLAPGNFLLSGFVNSDSAAVTKTTGTYASPNVGSGILVSTTLAAGDFSPVGSTNLANYTLPTSASGLIGSINPASLTVIANNATKIYDAIAYSGGNGVTYGGFVNGETAAVLGGVLTYGGTSQGAVNAGSYTITPGGLTSSNYTISYVDGILTINPAALGLSSVTANNAGKTYGATLTFAGNEFTSTGLVNGDTIGSVTLTSPGAVNTANVGTYPITPSNAVFSVGSASNYTITYVDGQLTVNPAALTIAAANATKIYDAIPYSGGNGVTYGGFVNGETAAVLGGVLTYGGTSQGAVNAGSYTITPGGLTSSNYTISYVDGILTINPAALGLSSVTANNAGKTYGTALTFAGNEFTSTGLVKGDTIGSVTLTSPGAVNTANVGTYPITPSNAVFSVGSASNYTITYVDGQLTVNPAALTVTANAPGKVYGNTDPTLTYVASGLLFNDTLTGGLTRATGENVGSYAITQGALNNPNYTISYTGNNLSITPASLTVAAANATKTYDAIAYSGGNGVTYGGFVNGETAAVLGGVLTYGGTSQGAVNAGSYTITPGGLTSSNYTISYTDGKLTVNTAPLTVAANALSKTAGSLDPLLTYMVTGLKLADTEATTLSGALARLAGEAVGAYQVNQGTLTLLSTNYTMNYAPADFSILPAPATPTIVSALMDNIVVIPPSVPSSPPAPPEPVQTPAGNATTTDADADAKKKDAEAAAQDAVALAAEPVPAAAPLPVCK